MNQPPYGQPPHSAWGPTPGAPPQGAYGPPPGHSPYGPPPGAAPYGHPPHGSPYGHAPHGAAYGPTPQADPRVIDLDRQSNTWMIVSLVGFFFGVGFVTGPLSWINGGRLRRQYMAMGLPPSSPAQTAWIVGIICTAFSALAIIGTLIFFVFLGTALAIL